MLSELNIQVGEARAQKSCEGTRSLKVGFGRARWEAEAEGLGAARGSGGQGVRGQGEKAALQSLCDVGAPSRD